MTTQHELTTPSPLLTPRGRLAQVGWARQPLLDCNLEAVRFCPALLRPLQRLRVKRWDYYGVTTPQRFFSFTLADLGYAGQAFVYTVDFASGRYHEDTVTIPFSRGLVLPRNSSEGESHYDNGKLRLSFQVTPAGRGRDHRAVHRTGAAGHRGGDRTDALCDLRWEPRHPVDDAGRVGGRGWLQLGGLRRHARGQCAPGDPG